MTRRDARIHVMQMLFETDFQPDKPVGDVYFLFKESMEIPDNDFMKDLFFGVCAHREAFDGLISKYAEGWSLDRISHVAHGAMLISIYEMYFRTDVPVKVSLNEALELVKAYDDVKAVGFVNGILNSIKDNRDRNPVE